MNLRPANGANGLGKENAMSDDLVKRLRANDLDECYDAADRIEALEAENELLKLSRPQWQPIETAPRDGTRIRGFWQYTYLGDGERTYGERVIEWHEELCGWLDDEREVHTRGAEDNTGLFTHWVPLLEPPVKVTEAAKGGEK